MQTEAQVPQLIPALETPEFAPAGDSTPIKKQHGGKRPGAGRRPNQVKRFIGRLAPLSAGQILDGIDVEGTIAETMKKGSLTLKQRTLADLMDRAWGRPAQTVSVLAPWLTRIGHLRRHCALLSASCGSNGKLSLTAGLIIEYTSTTCQLSGGSSGYAQFRGVALPATTVDLMCITQ